MRHNTNRSLEQKYRSAVAGLYARLKSNYDMIYEEFGDNGIKLIADMGHRYGLEVAERARKRVKGHDIRSVGEYVLRIFETAGEEIEVTEVSENRMVDKPEMCLAHTMMEKTVVEELSTNLTYRISKSISVGDSYCEHIIEIKKPSNAR